ncbi:MAG: hypothetical protein RSC41_02890, partial [Oscillospiraceae bacterium]
TISQLKAKANLQDDEVLLVGYDVGGFEISKYISENSMDFGGAVLMSPSFEKYDEKSVAIDNGSYVPNIPWINELNKDNFDFPIFLLSTTTDEYSTPQLMTMLYNHISDDDIQRSVGAYNAKSGNVSLAIETGVLHSFIPISDNIFSKVQQFIQDECTLETQIIDTNMYLQNILWCGIIVSAIGLLSAVFCSVKYKFSDISIGIVTAKTRHSLFYFVVKIVAIIISFVLVSIFATFSARVLPNINPSVITTTSFIGFSGAVSLLFFKKAVLCKETKLFRSNQIDIKYKNIFLSLLVAIFDVAIVGIIIFTGYFNNSPTISTLMQGFYLLFMSFIGIYAYIFEVETIRAISKEKYVDILYEIISLLPLVIFVLWYAVTAQYMLSFETIINIIIFIVTMISAFIMKEINGNKVFTSLIMALFFTLSMIILR